MASAIQLTATATVSSGYGLGVSANLTAQISTFQNQTPIKTLSTMFANVSAGVGNVTANITPILGNLGVGVTNGTQWLIDFYPGNVTPVCNGSVAYYVETPTPQYHMVGLEEVFVGYTYTPVTTTASFSNTLLNQAQTPFANGLSGFANVYGTVTSYATNVFDTVSSVYLLQNKTYAQSGIGYTGPLDLATQGINANGWIISNAVSSWGTMYDVNNINTIGNVYVFGQNLLNQGLGNYGGLANQLTAVGLDVSNLLAVPQPSSASTQSTGTTTKSTTLGAVEYPTTETTVTTSTPAGVSTNVLTSIYQSITGANLSAIVAATGITNTANINTLADFLTLQNVIPPANYTALSALGVTTINGFGSYLQTKIGQGTYTSWSQIAGFVANIESPHLYNTVTTANSTVITSGLASSLLSTYGTGSGPFNNPIPADFLGACAGIPYTVDLQCVNAVYANISNAVNLPTLANTLNAAVTTYINNGGMSDPTPISNAVNAINTALNTANSNSNMASAKNYYYAMLNHLTTEYNNINRAGVIFNSGYTSTLQSFAKQIGSTAADKTQYQNYQFFANIITQDSYGDTIRLAVAETINTNGFNRVGFPMNNDPNPAGAISQSQLQNVPLTTYISQNQ